MLVEKGNFDKDDQGWKLDEQFCSIGIENHDQLCQKLSTFTIFRISFWIKMMVEWACSISHQKLINKYFHEQSLPGACLEFFECFWLVEANFEPIRSST